MGALEKNKIMIAMDRSQQALDAALYASNLLKPENTRIVLLHVVKANPWRLWGLKKDPDFKSDVADGLQTWERRQKKAMQDTMDTALLDFKKAGFAEEDIDFITLEGGEGVARDILEEAQDGYDAVLVGRVGTSQLKDMVIGGTAMKLVNKLTKACVCVVGGKPSGDNVLLALDDSEGSMKVVEKASKILVHGQGRITLFHALTNKERFQAYLDSYFPPGFEEQWIKRAQETMEKIFAQSTEILLKAGIDPARIETKIQKDAVSASGTIVDQAKKGGYGTIFIGRRGMTAVEEFLIGGVSKKVVHLAKNAAVWVVN